MTVEPRTNFRETQDKLTQSMRGLGKLETFHVSAKIPTADREKTLDEFAQSKRSLITNARCLTEGVDVKQILRSAEVSRH